MFVGPEGGFAPGEVSALDTAVAVRFGVGPLVPQVETAAVLAVRAAAHPPATRA